MATKHWKTNQTQFGKELKIIPTFPGYPVLVHDSLPLLQLAIC